MIKSKRGQFYIIAAVIVIVLILSLTVIYNNIQTKKEPKKFYEIGDVLKYESLNVVNHAEYNKEDVNTSVENYLMLFSKYLEQNTQEDFNLIILYGDVRSNNITAKVYSRSSIGDVNIDLGGPHFIVEGGEEVATDSVKVVVNTPSSDGKESVNVTISKNGLNITQTLPVLPDNNFVFVLTTNSGFNQYVTNSLAPKLAGVTGSVIKNESE